MSRTNVRQRQRILARRRMHDRADRAVVAVEAAAAEALEVVVVGEADVGVGVDVGAVGPGVVGVGGDVRLRRVDDAVQDAEHAQVVALQVVGDERRRTQRVVGQEDARRLPRRQLLAIAEDAGAGADRGLAMDQGVAPDLLAGRRVDEQRDHVVRRADARQPGQAEGAVLARQHDQLGQPRRRSAGARRSPPPGPARPRPRAPASWRCRGPRDRRCRTPISTPAAERWRTSWAPKIRASPAYWSKRSWTRPSSIVSSTLDRRRRPPVRSIVWMRWPQVAAVSPVAAIEAARPRTGSGAPCPTSTAPSGARNSPSASGASRGRTHRVSSGVSMMSSQILTRYRPERTPCGGLRLRSGDAGRRRPSRRRHPPRRARTSPSSARSG